MPETLSVGFIGAGQMATALARGFIRGGVLQAANVVASDPSETARQRFQRETGGSILPTNAAVAEAARVLVLAVKPAQVVEVLEQMREALSPNHLLISIAAGVPISKLQGAAPAGSRVVRVMPNTPALAGASATAYALGSSASIEDARLVELLFSAVGVAVQVKEQLLDGVTGLSGSGPAYVCAIIEALADGGVAVGLPRDLALKLAGQTVLGTAKMVLETGLHPGQLKDMVASPGGTTIEGLHELEKGALRATLMNAVRAAAEKSKRMGQ